MKSPYNAIIILGLFTAAPAYAVCGSNEAVYLGSQSQYEEAAQASQSASQQAIQADTNPNVSNPAGKSTQQMQAAHVVQGVAYDRAQGRSNLINDLANDNYDPYHGYGYNYNYGNRPDLLRTHSVIITNPQNLKAPLKASKGDRKVHRDTKSSRRNNRNITIQK